MSSDALWATLRILGWTAIALLALVLLATKDTVYLLLKPSFKPSPLRKLKGPKGGTLMMGQRKAYSRVATEPDAWINDMHAKYGPAVVLRGSFNVRPPRFFSFSRRVGGKGVLFH